MSRHLLTLSLLMWMTGCSSTRPILSSIVVTPPSISFRQTVLRQTVHRESGPWTAVDVEYPNMLLAPAPCSPSSDHPVELVDSVDRSMPYDTDMTPLSLPCPESAIPITAPVMIVRHQAMVHPAVVSLDQVADLSSDQSALLACEPSPVVPALLNQASVSVTYPAGTQAPCPCSPGTVAELAVTTSRHVQQISHADNGELSGPQLDSPINSSWKPVTRIASVNSTQSSTSIRCDQVPRPSINDGHTSERDMVPHASVSAEIVELMTEIRLQRQLIEDLQRDLKRERLADDSAIDELEQAVESLLVLTESAPSTMSSTSQK